MNLMQLPDEQKNQDIQVDVLLPLFYILFSMIFDQWFLDINNNVPVPKTIRKRIENWRKKEDNEKEILLSDAWVLWDEKE